MARLTLTDIQKAADKNYQSLEIEFGDDVLVLSNFLRLDKATRQRIIGELDRAGGGDEADHDMIDNLRSQLREAATDKKLFDKFSNLLGDDGAQWVEVSNAWIEKTQVGEA